MKLFVVITTWQGHIDDPEVFTSEEKAMAYYNQKRQEYLADALGAGSISDKDDKLDEMWEEAKNNIWFSLGGDVEFFPVEVKE